jgi:methyl-accepting chemotaxis protein
MARGLNRRRLKNFFIIKDLQFKFIAINFIHMLLLVLITVVSLLAPIYFVLAQGASFEDQYRAAKFFIVITEQLPMALGLVLVLFGAHQLIMTHQFCGPIVNFSNTFKKIAGGDLTRKVRLRKHDFLQEEGTCINDMIDGLSQLIGSISREHEGLLRSLGDVSVSPSTADERQKSDRALGAALQQAQAIRKYLETFKLAQELPENS